MDWIRTLFCVGSESADPSSSPPPPPGQPELDSLLIPPDRIKSGGSLVNFWRSKVGHDPIDATREPRHIRLGYPRHFDESPAVIIPAKHVASSDDGVRHRNKPHPLQDFDDFCGVKEASPTGNFKSPDDMTFISHAEGGAAIAETEIALENEEFGEEEGGGGEGYGEGEGDDDLFKKPKIIGFTIDDALEYIGFGSYQLLLTLVAGLGWMAAGMVTVMVTILNPSLQCAWHIAAWKQAVLAVSLFAGMGSSGFFWGYMADRFGRRRTLMAASWLLFYECVLCTFTPSYVWILFLRWMVGFSLGCMPQVITLYAEEMPKSLRGQCVIILQGFWVLGCLVEICIGIFSVPLHWRNLVFYTSLGPFLFALTIGLVKESPRYLATCSKDAALIVLEDIAKANCMQLNLPGIFLLDTERPSQRGNFCGLFRPVMRWTTLSLFFIWFAATFAHYGTMLMTSEIFRVDGDVCSEKQNLGKFWTEMSCGSACRHFTYTDYNELLFSSLAELLGIFFALFFVDRWGRKWTLALTLAFFSGFIGMQCWCFCNVIYLVVTLFAARGLVTAGIQTAHLYTAEAFPTHIRSVAMGLSMAMGQLGAISTPFSARVLLAMSPHAAFGLYALVCLVAAGLSLKLPSETADCGMPEVVDFDKGTMSIGGELVPSCDYLLWCPVDNTELIQNMTNPCRPQPPKDPCDVSPVGGKTGSSKQ